MLVKITLFAALLLSIVVPFAYFLSGTKNKARYKLTIGTNAAAFFGIMLVACGFMFSGNAQAAEAAAETANAAGGLSTGMGYLAAALVTGLSCIGGGIAVASAASAALGAISEDSSILGKSLIFVGSNEIWLAACSMTIRNLNDQRQLVIQLHFIDQFWILSSELFRQQQDSDLLIFQRMVYCFL